MPQPRRGPRQPPRRGPDWETAPARVRFLRSVFAWIIGTVVYAAVLFFFVAAAPAAYRGWVAAGAFLLYLVGAAAFAVLVLGGMRREG